MLDLKRILLIAASLLWLTTCDAATFLNLKKQESLASIIERNPGLKFVEDESPGVDRNRKVYRVFQAPVAGRITLYFEDSRKALRQKISDHETNLIRATPNQRPPIADRLSTLKAQLERPLNQQLLLSEITWTPFKWIPKETVVKEHGQPVKETLIHDALYRDFDFHYYWNDGLEALGSSDGKDISVFIFHPTDTD